MKYFSLECKIFLEVCLGQRDPKAFKSASDYETYFQNQSFIADGQQVFRSLSSDGQQLLDKWQTGNISELESEINAWITFPRLRLLHPETFTPPEAAKAELLKLVDSKRLLTPRAQELITCSFSRKPREWLVFVSDAIQRERVARSTLNKLVDYVSYADWAKVLAMEDFNQVVGEIKEFLLELLTVKKNQRDIIACQKLLLPAEFQPQEKLL